MKFELKKVVGRARRGCLVFERGTVPGAKSSEILTLEKAMRQAGQPEVFQDAAKTWLATKVSDAMRSTTNRMPQDVASRLRTAFGDPRQLDATSKGLEDVLAGLARSQGVSDAAYVKGFKNFMKIVSDASRRPASVRGTSFGQIEGLQNQCDDTVSVRQITALLQQQVARCLCIILQGKLSVQHERTTGNYHD